MVICEQRQKVLDEKGHVLVVGGPGSGKTTIALKKALQIITQGLKPGQAVLFLSFSRAAVARVAEASNAVVERSMRGQLSIQTFHSFCWDLLRSHGYLVGCPKGQLTLLMPQDEKALSGGLKQPQKGEVETAEWRAWQIERQVLFERDARISFDWFAPKAEELLGRCQLIRELVADRFPVIIVDEAQDTGHDAWRCIERLSGHSQVICLADLDQQIFDHLDGVGPERIEHIKVALKPLFIDLGTENNRSPGTEIASFANDILAGRSRRAAYSGVSRQMYNPKDDPVQRLRVALGRIYQAVKKATGEGPESIAILAPSGSGVAKISAALNGGEKPVRHKVLFDEAAALLSSRLAAFLLEPKSEINVPADVAICFELLAAVRRADGSKTAIQDAAKYLKWGAEIAAGKPPKTILGRGVEALVRGAAGLALTGDPGRDWLSVKALLYQSDQPEIKQVASILDYLIAFNRGKRIAANLSSMWMNDGAYVRARVALDSALVEDQLLAGTDDLRGIHVMTIHKSKGKQFDAVIVVREGMRVGLKGWRSSFIWRDDTAPYDRSRKILRVGITRAKHCVLMLEPFYPACPIMSQHVL